MNNEHTIFHLNTNKQMKSEYVCVCTQFTLKLNMHFETNYVILW